MISRDGKRIEHAAVAHGDAVIHRDGVKFFGDPASFFDLLGDDITEILEVDMARNELGVTVGDGNNRLAEVIFTHASGTPQGARRPYYGHESRYVNAVEASLVLLEGCRL